MLRRGLSFDSSQGPSVYDDSSSEGTFDGSGKAPAHRTPNNKLDKLQTPNLYALNIFPGHI